MSKHITTGIVQQGALENQSLQLTLNPTGTGAGVSVLKITASADIVATLSGNAKFYTNTAGTTGETATWNVTSGAERTVYLKNTSGTSGLLFNKTNEITSFYWEGLTNCPTIAGAIDTLRNLTNLRFFGYNTLSCDIAKLTKLTNIMSTVQLSGFFGDASKLNPAILTEFAVNGGSTMYGDMSLFTNLTKLMCGTGETITANITNLVNLTHLFCITLTDTFTGDCTNLTKMYNMEVHNGYENGSRGNNTISGSITGMTNLYNFWMGGNNTISGDISGLTDLYIFMDNSPYHTITGSLTNLTSLINLEVYGQNTINGNLGTNNVAGNLQNCQLSPCGMVDYTVGATWKCPVTINPSLGYGLSSTEIDNMLIDMAASTALVSKNIQLLGFNAPRTSASDAAVATLTGRGNTVTTQPIPVILRTISDNVALDEVQLGYDLPLDTNSIPATTDFTVTGKTISAVTISGSTVTLKVTVPFSAGDTKYVTYTKGTNPIRSFYHADVANLASRLIDLLSAEMVDQANWYKMSYWNNTADSIYSQVGNTIAITTGFGYLARNDFWVGGSKYKVVISYIWTSGNYFKPCNDGATVWIAPSPSQTYIKDVTVGSTGLQGLWTICNDHVGSITGLSIKKYL